MSLTDWSMTMLGFSAHRRAPQPLIGISHMPVHTAMQRCIDVGLSHGYLQGDRDLLHVGGIASQRVAAVDLRTLFFEERVAITEGVVGGTLVFVPQNPAAAGPPGDCLDLRAWAATAGLPRLEVIDNEQSWWADPPPTLLEALCLWFISAPPLSPAQRGEGWLEQARERFFGGLFDHGWTRNGELVQIGRKPSVDLWAGVHGRSMLGHSSHQSLSLVQHGMRLSLVDGLWRAAAIEGDCPLGDATGRLAPPLTP